jgi:hypothetical protein
LRSTRRKNTQRNHGGFKSEFHGSSPWIYMHGKRIYRARVPNGSAYACILATVTQNDGNGQSCQTNSDYTLQHENPVHHGISFGCFRHLKTK